MKPSMTVSPTPLSPIHDALLASGAAWVQNAHSAGVSRFTGSDAANAAQLGVADLSHLARTGVKGPGAANWLAALGLPLPPQPNSWLALPEGGLIARLGNTEYLIEAAPALIGQIMQAPRTAGIYPVLRQDAAFALCGERLNELLLQICNVDFRCLSKDAALVVLTSMAGVGVTVLRCGPINQPVYRLWCDGSYGLYLWETLCGIAEELGGGCIGLEVIPT